MKVFLDAKIETERLVLRPYCLEDIDAIYEIVSGEEDFFQYIPEEAPTRDEVETIIKWSIDQNRKNSPERIYKFNLAIVHKEDAKVIGYCGLGPDDLDLEEIEIYYGLSSAYRKQGLALEAAKATLTYGFETIGLKKIIAFADHRNVPSIKLIEKLGMNYHFRVSHLPEEVKGYDGQCFYSISSDQYSKLV